MSVVREEFRLPWKSGESGNRDFRGSASRPGGRLAISWRRPFLRRRWLFRKERAAKIGVRNSGFLAGRPSPRFCQRSAETPADFGPAPADLGSLPIVLGKSWIDLRGGTPVGFRDIGIDSRGGGSGITVRSRIPRSCCRQHWSGFRPRTGFLLGVVAGQPGPTSRSDPSPISADFGATAPLRKSRNPDIWSSGYRGRPAGDGLGIQAPPAD